MRQRTKLYLLEGALVSVSVLCGGGALVWAGRADLADRMHAEATAAAARIEEARARGEVTAASLESASAEVEHLSQIVFLHGDWRIAHRREAAGPATGAPRAPAWFEALLFPGGPVSEIPLAAGDEPAPRVFVAHDGAAALAPLWSSTRRGATPLLGLLFAGAGATAYGVHRSGRRVELSRERRERLAQEILSPRRDPPLAVSAVTATDLTLDAAREVLEHAADAVVATDLEGRVEVWSPAARRLFDYAEDEIKGQPLGTLVPRWAQTDFEQLLARLARGETLSNVEARWKGKHGRVLEVLITSVLRPPRADAPPRVLWSVRDVSETKEARRLAALQVEAVSSCREGILILDPNEKVVFANPGAGRLLGFEPAELVGAGAEVLLGGADPEELERLRRALSMGSLDQTLFRGRRRDGSPFYSELSFSQAPDTTGRALHTVVVLRDITAGKQQLEAREAHERVLDRLLESASVGLCEVGSAGQIEEVNPAFCKVLRAVKEDLLGSSFIDWVAEEHRERVSSVRQGRPFAGGDLDLTASTRERISVLAHSVERSGVDSSRGLVVFAQDISGRRRSEAAVFAAKERAQHTLDSMGEAVITTNAEGVVDYVNPIAEEMTGRHVEEMRGLPHARVCQFIEEGTREPIQDPVDRCLKLGKGIDIAQRALITGKNGIERAVQLSVTPVRDRERRIIGAVVVFRDVTQLRAETREIAQQATTDPLTGLMNRREFERQLAEVLGRARDESSEPVVGFLDLDKFKIVNDTCGHVAGDELLRQVSGILGRHVRQADVVARMGGDEFAFLLRSCPLENAMEVAEGICRALSDHRFAWEDKTFKIGGSIGLVPIGRQDVETEAVLRAADTACYAAKESGRSQVYVYRGAAEGAVQPTPWLQTLERALEQDSFALYLQSIVPLREEVSRDNQMHEVLLRMQHDDGTLLPPNAFLPHAERYRLLPRIDRWVVGNAFAALARLREAEPRGERLLGEVERGERILAINLSHQSMADASFAQFVLEQLERTRIPAPCVCFEVSETTAVSFYANVLTFMQALKERGFLFSIDDFGSGLSSLAYLRRLPFDFLKLESALVRGVVQEPLQRILVESYCRFARELGIHVIAESVEDQGTTDVLANLGVDYGQGFALEKPFPLESVA